MENLPSTIIAISVLIGLGYGVVWVGRKNSAVRSILKTLPVLLLAMAALISETPMLLFLALLLSAAGDAFLSRDGEAAFLAGLGSFLTAHLVFAVLFLKFPSGQIVSGLVLNMVIAITILMILLVLSNLWKHLGSMKIPVVIYTLIIGLMNISAWGTGQSALLLAGVTLFVFSDMVLAHEIFFWKKPEIKKFAAYTVWFSYFIAQTMITVSFF